MREMWMGKLVGWGRQTVVAGILVWPAGWAPASGTGELLAALMQPGSHALQTVQLSHREVCAALEQAGMQLTVVAYDGRDQVIHVYFDAVGSRYVSVSGTSPSRVRVTPGLPDLRGYTLQE